MLGNGWTYLMLGRTKESVDQYRQLGWRDLALQISLASAVNEETCRRWARQNSLPLLFSASLVDGGW
jgi:hypothetical protein